MSVGGFPGKAFRGKVVSVSARSVTFEAVDENEKLSDYIKDDRIYVVDVTTPPPEKKTGE